MLYFIRRKPKPATKIIKRKPKEKRKQLLSKRQLNSPPDTKTKELVEEVMDVISGMMYDGYDWVMEQEILDAILDKQPTEDRKEQEIREALKCGVSFGLILKYLGQYSLSKKVLLLIEEGKVPDWNEFNEDWPSKPKKVKRMKKGRRKKDKRKRRS